jgi:hypothetical protein
MASLQERAEIVPVGSLGFVADPRGWGEEASSHICFLKDRRRYLDLRDVGIVECKLGMHRFIPRKSLSKHNMTSEYLRS